MTAAAIEYETFALDDVCKLTGAPSPDWLTRRLKVGDLPGVLAGQQWRLTRADMVAVVDYMRAIAAQRVAKNTGRTAVTAETAPAPTNPAGLSARSAARMRRTATP